MLVYVYNSLCMGNFLDMCGNSCDLFLYGELGVWNGLSNGFNFFWMLIVRSRRFV